MTYILIYPELLCNRNNFEFFLCCMVTSKLIFFYFLSSLRNNFQVLALCRDPDNAKLRKIIKNIIE